VTVGVAWLRPGHRTGLSTLVQADEDCLRKEMFTCLSLHVLAPRVLAQVQAVGRDGQQPEMVAMAAVTAWRAGTAVTRPKPQDRASGEQPSASAPALRSPSL